MQPSITKQIGTEYLWDNPNETAKSREVRLGLVMYGGVSLAIYINGVANEFFRAVQGRGVYGLIKTFIDADVVVDIISGTSAGGVNGIMLAYALCNQKDFGNTATLWRKHGGIKNLLHDPFKDKEPASVLDSTGYYQPHLKEVFAEMKTYSANGNDAPSETMELDLFITGTDVDGKIYTQFDDAGHPIDIKDHRSVFWLKHRKGRKEPFATKPGRDDKRFDALAKLARITSCFPAAFEPVHVTKTDEKESPDYDLQEWGRLGKDAVLIDGGVLDNKPFTYTTKAIFSRAAKRDVDRKLFFIEPDPEPFEARSEATRPTALKTVLAALIGIPSYESIADDLKLLAERNSRLEQYKRLVHRIEKGVTHAPGANDLYRRSRLVSICDRVIEGIFKENGQPSPIETSEDRQKSRELIEEFDRLITNEAAQRSDELFENFDIYYRLRKTFRIIYLLHELLYSPDPQSSTPVANTETYLELLSKLNRQAKLYEVLQNAMEKLIDEASYPWKKATGEALWTMVQDSLLALLQTQGFDYVDLESGNKKGLLPKKFDPDQPWFPQKSLTHINKKLNGRTKDILEAIRDSKENQTFPPKSPCMLGHVAELEKQIIDHYLAAQGNDPVYKAYSEFDFLDSVLYPIELVGSLQEKDIIETIRISPKDAQRGFSENTLKNKVAGDAAYHFGGFFKRSWRSNDILWGRLDGLCQLTENLLSHERVMQIVSSDNGRKKVCNRIFEGSAQSGSPVKWKTRYDPATLFPNAGQITQDNIRRWFESLLIGDINARRDALEKKRFDEMVTLLIEAAQLQVLFEEVPNVITDAIDEQREWNRCQVVDDKAKKNASKNGTTRQGSGTEEASSDNLHPWIFKALDQYTDPLCINMNSTACADLFVKSKALCKGDEDRPLRTPLGKFFVERYEVGKELLTHDIPTIVLLETLATVLLVTQNVLIGSFHPDTQARIKGSKLYRFGLYYPLRAFYGLTWLARNNRAASLGVSVGIIILSLCALIAGIVGWDRIWYSQHTFSFVWFAVFILVPALLTVAATGYLVFVRKKDKA